MAILGSRVRITDDISYHATLEHYVEGHHVCFDAHHVTIVRHQRGGGGAVVVRRRDGKPARRHPARDRHLL